jgi:hypothetical protein
MKLAVPAVIVQSGGIFQTSEFCTVKPFICTLFFAAVFAASPALAAGAPPQALNKTISLSWGTSGVGKRADGATVAFNNVNTRTIYISSAGRPFLRMQVSASRKSVSRSGERAPGENPGKGNVHFEGNRLVGVEGFASGARQYVVTFDPGFSSCTVSVIDAKGAGGKIKRRGPDGAFYEIDSVTTSSPSCSIQSGNAFSGS